MRLLRVYPASWRKRYGDELVTLIDELGQSGRMSWSVRLDVVRAGVAQRVRTLGLAGLPPSVRAREGSLLVLYAWGLFVLGGFGLEKAAEHWQAVTPTADQRVPAAAFDGVVVAAAIGSTLVLLGVVVLLPRLASMIRQGGWPIVRPPIVRASVLTLLTVAATVGLALWAHSLTPAARNGHYLPYEVVFGAWLALVAGCLFAWAAAGAATARRLSWSNGLLRLEAWLSLAVTATMAAMTIAAAVWWTSLAGAAPWFFTGRPIGSHASALVANMIVPMLAMLCATVIALFGAARARDGLVNLPPGAGG